MRHCPDPEVLAAYLDRTLSLAERATLEAHLASCPHCLAAVAGAFRTLAAVPVGAPFIGAVGSPSGAPPRGMWRSLAEVAAAAAAAVAVIVVPALLSPLADRDTALVSLAGSAGNVRPVLGRPTGGFPHAPLGEPPAGGQDGRPAEAVRIVQAAGKIRESFGDWRTPSRLHELGMAQLFLRNYDEAAWALQAAVREQPDNARFLNDLAVLRLERARLGLRPDDLPRALSAAERARQLDPSLREAWFNRALAITRLSLRDQARRAWTEYLALDGASAWAAEARAQLEQLSQPTPAELWPGIEERLRRDVTPALAEEAVRTQVTESRGFLERTLLPAWAAAVEAGRDASPEREALRVMAEAYLRVTGDALYRDTVTAIDRAEGRGRDALLALARAHQRYQEAAALFEQDLFGQAEPVFAAARDALGAAGSPFAVRAVVELGAIAYVGGRAPEAERLLRDALSNARSAGYSYVQGRATWFQGLLAFGQGRLADAQARYEDTLEAFERSGDAEQASTVQGLLGGVAFELGDEIGTWRHLEMAGRGLGVSRSARHRQAVLTAVGGALGNSNVEASLMVFDELLKAAIASGRQAGVVDGLRQRAAILAIVGRHSEAVDAAQAARQSFRALADSALRDLVEINLLKVEGELLRRDSPAQAVAAAERGLDALRQRGDRMRVAQFNLQLAKANIVWGRRAEARAALERGIQAFRQARQGTNDERRIAATDEAWQLFETGAELAILDGDLPRAFEMAEAARSRTLAESRRLPANRSLPDVQRALEPNEAIVALNQFEDSLAVWVIRRGRATVERRPVSRQEARRLVSRQRDEIRLAASRPEAGGKLFEAIVRPVAKDLRGVTRLIVVPDAPYYDASFAALWDPSRERFLIEDVTLTLATSAASIVWGRQQASAAPGSAAPLVLGSADAASEADVRAVAAVYGSADVLAGRAATPSRFFAEAPARSIVHVSAPAAPNGDYPLLSRLLLADEGSRRYSGTVLGRDIAARSFGSTRLVVLARPARIDSEGNADATGVARAFLTAGVPAVVSVLPGTDERAAQDMLVAFHKQLAAGMPPSQALTTCQRSALESSGRRLGAWSALVMYGSDR